ncbi:MAG: hypothetical protein JNK16_02315 [Phycisphaerales bacterium]|nr:hypothetical protein [Phycisphaerales bacterium]
MAVVSLLFLGLTVFCGVLAFGDGATRGIGVHAGFLIGIVGFVSVTVSMLARWASNTLDDVPGQKTRRSR